MPAVRLTIVVALVICTTLVPSADSYACGPTVFGVEDKTIEWVTPDGQVLKGGGVRFYSSNLEVYVHTRDAKKTQPVPGYTPYGIGGDRRPRYLFDRRKGSVQRKEDRIVDVRGTKVFYRGKEVGSVQGRRLTLGQTRYDVGVQRKKKAQRFLEHYYVKVKQGSATLAFNHNVPFTQCSKNPRPKDAKTFRQALQLYLVWRHFEYPRFTTARR